MKIYELYLIGLSFFFVLIYKFIYSDAFSVDDLGTSIIVIFLGDPVT